jgi:hypothetical protein
LILVGKNLGSENQVFFLLSVSENNWLVLWLNNIRVCERASEQRTITSSEHSPKSNLGRYFSSSAVKGIVEQKQKS